MAMSEPYSKMGRKSLAVLIVAEHASALFGGEAIIPLHCFRKLRGRGIDAWMIVHERTRAELTALMPGEIDRLYFIPDTWLHKALHGLGRFLPQRISNFTVGYMMRLSSQLAARKVARNLIAEKGISVVHQPIPVSPREPSLLYNLGAPVVMGPFNGGMTYPPAWESGSRSLRFVAILTDIARRTSQVLHWAMPGKLRAAIILVANDRTRRALPPRCQGNVITLIENGVDPQVWSMPPRERAEPSSVDMIEFAFIGRLVDWKAVDLLLLAFAQVVASVPAKLTIYGDGPMKRTWQSQAQKAGLQSAVFFAGWLTQDECSQRLGNADVLVLPSLFEAGGAVVLEAMACGLPVVATNWGGPPDYIDETCGILVDPVDPDRFVAGLASAMLKLARSPELRASMGRAGANKVMSGELNWDHKVERLLRVYEEAIERTSTVPTPNKLEAVS